MITLANTITTHHHLSTILRRIKERTGLEKLQINKWSPGDGKTRYTLVLKEDNDNKNGGGGIEREIYPTILGSGNMYDCLKIVEEVFYLMDLKAAQNRGMIMPCTKKGEIEEND